MRTTFACWVACFVASQAAAGTIALQVSHRAELRDGELRAVVGLSNGGDETAYQVTPVLRFRGAETRGATQAALPTEVPAEVSLAVPSEALGEGQWPYEIAVEYADANLYPFQALSVATLTVGSPPLVKLAVAPLGSPVLAGETELELQVKNLSGDERRVTLKVLAPEAVEVRNPPPDTPFEPWEERVLTVALTNRNALPGSRFPLFATLEYEDGSVHQTLVAQTTLEVRPEAAWFGPRGRYVWTGAAIFGALFAGLVGLRVLRR